MQVLRAAPFLLASFAAALSACSSPAEPPKQAPPEHVPDAVDLLSFAKPMLGTGGFGFGFGSAYPGPALPFAMIHASPDTRAKSGMLAGDHPAGYLYDDDYIAGFSLTHFHGTGALDYGTIAFMPTDGMTIEKRDETGYLVKYSHDKEQASIGYYQVHLATDINVEITTDKRAALFRFTFGQGTDPVVLVDLQHTIAGESAGGEVTIDPTQRTMHGMMHDNGKRTSRFGGFDTYFQAAFDVTPSGAGVWDDQGLHDGEHEAKGIDLGAWFRFPAGTKQVMLRTAISFVDDTGADKNLAAEIPTFDFDATRNKAKNAWKAEFGRFSWHGVSERDATILGTAIYHALLMPTLTSDEDGRYLGVDGAIKTTGGPRYTDFSLWDTYRTLHPWLLFSEHPAQLDFVHSLLGMAQEGGAVPRWPMANGETHSMIGTPGETVIAESAAKGLTFDQEKAYALCRVTAFGKPSGAMGGRGAIDSYLKYGFVPADVQDGSVSKTMEYAVTDAALAGWATRLGKEKDAAVLGEHAQSWKKLYDAKVGFFHGKNADGTWSPWPGPTATAKEFVQGNAWQYLWMVPQDPDALGEVLGGQQAALDRLRALFDLSKDERPIAGHRKYYWQANEPDIIAPWLFAAWGSPDETLAWNRWIIDEQYGLGPDGLPGNDDGGTMSSWTLFAATGLYPVVGTERYIVGVPMVRRVVLHRASGELTIETDRDPGEHGHLLRVLLDGKELDGRYVTHSQLQGSHRLLFELDSLR